MRLFLLYLKVLLHGNKGRFKSFKDYKERRTWCLAEYECRPSITYEFLRDDTMNRYSNECYSCGQTWDSEFNNDSCPNCGTDEDLAIGTERIDEETDQKTEVQ